MTSGGSSVADDALQRLQAVHRRQPDVEQHDVHGLASEGGEAFFGAIRQQGLEPFILQYALQRAADLRLVIHDQDGVHFVRWLPRSRPQLLVTLR